jgi:hypothetical protein
VTVPDVQPILEDHSTDLTRIEDEAWNTYGRHRFGVSYQQGYRRARRDTLQWVMGMLTDGFDDLTPEELVAELRKGDRSLFWPLWRDDPYRWVECPSDRVHQRGARVLVGVDGTCSDCGYDYTTSARIGENE